MGLKNISESGERSFSRGRGQWRLVISDFRVLGYAKWACASAIAEKSRVALAYDVAGPRLTLGEGNGD